MRSAGTSSWRSTSPATKRDDHDDPVGPARVRAGKRRVIAFDLAGRALRMRQKVEIVNGHDLRCRLRWHEQRVRRVGNIELASRKLFNRRPLESMPRKIQHAYGNSPIDTGARVSTRRHRPAAADPATSSRRP